MSVFDMGSHGFYVWLSYGVSLLVLFYLAIEPFRARKNLVKKLVGRRVRMEQRQEDLSSAP